MPKGGARARSGPAPDPESLRSADGEWTVLPAEGRQGPPPAWPLSEASEREVTFWEHEWSRPQAVMWQRQDQVLEVAMFVRALAEAEKPDASVASRTLVRQLMETLGVSMPGLLRNRWKIGSPVVVSVDEGAVAPSTRDRLRVVGG
jgi:hypothetical protein